MAGEVELAAILCGLVLGGEAGVRHEYRVIGETRHIYVDCETATHVVEVGLDVKRSSYDSLHQALFASDLTGKIPLVVLIDTNGVEEPVEYQVETVSALLGVGFLVYTEAALHRVEWVSRYLSGQPDRPTQATVALN